MTDDFAKAGASRPELQNTTDAPSASWRVIAHCEDNTEALGQALGAALQAGGLVALVGPLGAGKTRLVQAIATQLGADRRAVNSPTFVLIQEYDAAVPVFHCDTYRLRNVTEFLDLGVDDLYSEGVCLIEWADRVQSVLPSDHLRIEIVVAGPQSREFQITAHGPRSANILAATRSAAAARGISQADSVVFRSP